MVQVKNYFIGELIGTFILVFIGCGSVAVSVLGIGLPELYQVAIIWGIGVIIAIIVSRKWSPAHLNPAVTFGFHVVNKFSRKHLLSLLSGQFFGALLGGLGVLLLFNNGIMELESNGSILRGSQESYKTALMFGEFYPNPGFEDSLVVDIKKAFSFELLGTFALMLIILFSDMIGKRKSTLQPLIIGFGLSILIYFIAPYTQAGFNPFRDFSPRLVAYFAGWGRAAFPVDFHGAVLVYMLAPIIGAVCASILMNKFRSTL